MVEVGPATDPVTRTTLSWDTETSSCQPNGGVDNNLCRQVVEGRNGGVTPNAVTTWSYNTEGGVLSVAKANATQDAMTTFGYQTQFTNQAGTTTIDNVIAGGGVVRSGSRDAAASALFVLSDRTEVLTPRGNAASSTAFRQFLTQFDVDANASAAPNRSSGTYDTCSAARTNTGLVCSQVEPALSGSAGRRTTTFTYDALGQRLTSLSPKAAAADDPADRVPTRYHYYADAERDLSGTTPAGGWLKAVEDPDGNFAAFAYDAAGNVVRTWDRNATQGRSVSDFPGTTTTPPTQRYTETRYAAGDAAQAFARPWRYVLFSQDPLGNVTTNAVDPNGNVKAATPPRGNEAGNSDYDVTADYDRNDRMVARVTPSGRRTGTDRAWRFGYDASGNRVSLTNPLGRVTVWAYDDANRNVKKRWTRGEATGAGTSGCAEVADAADAPLQSGRLVCQQSFTYDGHGNVTTSVDADGHSTTSTFDALGRETRRSVARSNTTDVQTGVLYDIDGNVTDVCSPREFTEGLGRCSGGDGYSTRLYSTHVDYDAAGATSQIIAYRANGPSPATTLRESYTYDADGNPAATTNARGKTTTTEFDLLGRKTSQTVPRSATVSNTTQWRHDRVGNVTAVIWPDPVRGGADASDDRVTAYSYDANNRVVDVVAAADSVDAAQAGLATGSGNRRTRRGYDANGNVVAVWGPRAFTQSITAPNRDFVVRTEYDAEDRPAVQLVPRADETTAGPADDEQSRCTGHADFDVDTLVCRTAARYDEVGNRTRLVLPTSDHAGDNRYIDWSYTDDDLVSKVNVSSPVTAGQRVDAAVYAYDGSGRPVSVTAPLPGGKIAAETFQWSFDGLLERHERQDSNAAAAEPGRSDVAHVTTHGYNAAGNPISETNTVDGTPRTTSRTYTSDGLVAQLRQPGGRTTTYEYNESGQPAAVYSPNANVWRGDADAATAGLPTRYTYTDDGLADTVTVPIAVAGDNFRRTTYGYDDAGRKTSQHVQRIDDAAPPAVLSDGGKQQFKYWPTDDLRTEVGRGSETIDTIYDAAGNPTKVTQTVDGIPSAVTASYYFDDLVRTVDDGTTTSSYTYDGAGQVVVRKHDDNLTTYGYNDAGLATKATSDRTGNTRTWQWTYDIQGRAATEQQPDGRDADWDWNDDNTLRQYTVTDTDSSVVSKWQYTYDELYRITVAGVPEAKGAGAETADTSTRRYRYDTAGRVDCYTIDTAMPADCAAATSGDVKHGDWDANNNRLAWGKQRFTYNADDTIKTATDKTGANPQTLAYHTFGGLNTDGCGAYAYDGFDRLKSLSPMASPTATGCSANAATVSYGYDGLDRQRTKTITPPAPTTLGPKTTSFSYDGLTAQTIKQVDSGDSPKPARNFTLGADGAPKAVTAKDSTGLDATEFLQTDGHGNIAATLKDGAGVSCTVRYDPFGTPEKVGTGDQQDGVCNTGGETSNDLFYRGGRRDNTTGNYQLGSRTYDPNRAGFLTPDSYRKAAPQQDLSVGVDPLTRNRYSYVNGDPVNLTDPDGHSPCYEGDSPHPSCNNKPARPYKARREGGSGGDEPAPAPTPVEKATGDEYDPDADYVYLPEGDGGVIGAVVATGRAVERFGEACGFLFDPCDIGVGVVAGIRGDGAAVAAAGTSAVPYLGAGTRAGDWAATASKAADGMTEATEQAAKAFDDLAGMRRSLDLPPAGSIEDKATLARLDIGDDKFYGINAHGQEYGPTGPGIHNATKWHAEADVFGQAARAGGSRGGSATIYVDRKPCPWCRNSMAGQARKLGLDQLVVVGPKGVDGAYISSVDRYVRAEWAP